MILTMLRLKNIVLLLTIVSSKEIFASVENTDEYINVSGKNLEAALVPDNETSAIEGLSADISCFAPSDSPLKECRWERKSAVDSNNGGQNRAYVIIKPKEIVECDSEFSDHGPYRYSGKSLQTGDCTLSIGNVSKYHAAEWECLLVGEQGQFWFGKLKLHSYESLGQPYFVNRTAIDFVYDTSSIHSTPPVHCCVTGGFRSMNVSFQMGIENDTKLNNGTDGFISTSKAEFQTCHYIQNYFFTPADNGKLFECSVTITHHNQQYIAVSAIPVVVRFSPRSSMNNVTRDAKIGENAVVSVPITSNPDPRVSWYVSTNPEDAFSYFEIKNNSKYILVLTSLGESKYNAELTVRAVTEDDYKRKFRMEALNQFGKVPVDVKIVSPNPGDEDGAYWTLIFIGIGAVIVLVALSLVLYFVIMRAKKRDSYIPTRMVYQNNQREQ